MITRKQHFHIKISVVWEVIDRAYEAIPRRKAEEFS